MWVLRVLKCIVVMKHEIRNIQLCLPHGIDTMFPNQLLGITERHLL